MAPSTAVKNTAAVEVIDNKNRKDQPKEPKVAAVDTTPTQPANAFTGDKPKPRSLVDVARDIDLRKKVAAKAQEQIDKLDARIKELENKKAEYVYDVEKVDEQLAPLKAELAELT